MVSLKETIIWGEAHLSTWLEKKGVFLLFCIFLTHKIGMKISFLTILMEYQ